ncbi:MAG: NAD(+)/NADH kinase [Spirochaetales bacterium]|nr:NAD(+)/NADH kinase [Spirochaetales bacterium]
MERRTVERVVILANTSKKDIREVCERFRGFLDGKGVKSSILGLSSSLDDLGIVIPDCDLVVSFGGDGTVLTCAELLKGRDVPILAVNMGSFGYMAETSVDELEVVFEEYLDGRTEVYSRMMLDVSVEREGKPVFSSGSLNDVTVSAISHARMARLDLYLNGTFGTNLKGDGLIIATPTGSTAYNLAAGGPILDASLDAIIINPICPFTMGVRPLVVNSDCSVMLSLPRQNTELSLTCDGHEVFSVREGDQITVKQSNDRALFVKNPRRRFIEVLRDKLSWAGGFNA